VYPSFINAESTRVEHSRLVHFPTEQAIRASGLAFTILRHALYADILVGDLQQTLATGVLRRPGGKARCAYVARADLGASAAQVLMRDEPSGRVYSETMEQTYSGDEVAALMSTVFATPVRYEAVAAAEWPRFMHERWGVPLELSKSTAGTMLAIEAGEFDLVSPDYREITGHPARSMHQFLESVRDAAHFR
jgi:NAD(P)H dehydrogenase (quinone)